MRVWVQIPPLPRASFAIETLLLHPTHTAWRSTVDNQGWVSLGITFPTENRSKWSLTSGEGSPANHHWTLTAPVEVGCTDRQSGLVKQAHSLRYRWLVWQLRGPLTGSHRVVRMAEKIVITSLSSFQGIAETVSAEPAPLSEPPARPPWTHLATPLPWKEAPWHQNETSNRFNSWYFKCLCLLPFKQVQFVSYPVRSPSLSESNRQVGKCWGQSSQMLRNLLKGGVTTVFFFFLIVSLIL